MKQINHNLKICTHVKLIICQTIILRAMGNCDNSACVQSAQHPVLGECVEVMIEKDKLIKIVEFYPDFKEIKHWEKRLEQAERKVPRLRDFVYVPVEHIGSKGSAFRRSCEFWFQNYPTTLMQKLENKSPQYNLPQKLIREVGKKLFQLQEAYPKIDQPLHLNHILINDQEQVRIVLQHLLPPCKNLELAPPQFLKQSGCSQTTQYSACPTEHAQINTLSNIYDILLCLTNENRIYSSQFTSIMQLIQSKPENSHPIKQFFLEVYRKPSHNYLLDTQSESMPNISDITSLFLLTDTSFNM